MLKKIAILLFLCFVASQNIFSQNSSQSNSSIFSPKIEGYNQKQTPQWLKDLRRTEIITFGSIPFVTIWTTLIYSGLMKGSIVNPLANDSSNSFTETDQKTIVLIACGISAFLGLADLAINLTERALEKNRMKKQMEDKTIRVIPLNSEEKLIEENVIMPEYMQGGLESAIF